MEFLKLLNTVYFLDSAFIYKMSNDPKHFLEKFLVQICRFWISLIEFKKMKLGIDKSNNIAYLS